MIWNIPEGRDAPSLGKHLNLFPSDDLSSSALKFRLLPEYITGGQKLPEVILLAKPTHAVQRGNNHQTF